MHITISKRFVEYWTRDTAAPDSSALCELFGFTSPSILKRMLKFKRMVEINCNVHLQTYNCIIAEEARKENLPLLTH